MATGDCRLPGQVQGQQEPWVGAGRIPSEGMEGKGPLPGARTPGSPQSPAEDKPRPSLCAKQRPLRKCVPCSGKEHLQSSLCIEFLFL